MKSLSLNLTNLFGGQKGKSVQEIELCANRSEKKKIFSSQHQTSININIVMVGESPNNLKQELLRPLYEISQDQNLNNPISTNLLTHNIHIENQIVKLQIYDTPSQERFMSSMQIYYKKANVILVIYDATNQKSFDKAENWINNVKKKTSGNIPLLLVACQCCPESNRIVSTQCGEKLASKHEIEYLECSMDEKSIQEVFMAVTKRALQNTSQAELPQCHYKQLS